MYTIDETRSYADMLYQTGQASRAQYDSLISWLDSLPAGASINIDSQQVAA